MRGRLAGAAVLAAILCAAPVGQTPVDADRERAYRFNNLGVALLEQFKYPEAAGAFRDALGTVPSLGLAHLNLGIALFYVPEHESARREAVEAARLLPALPQPLYLQGLIARAENRDDEAIGWFERVRAIDPRDAGTAINLAQIHLQNRRYDEAIALLRPVVADEPFNITAAYNLGLALTRAGQREAGERLMERSQALRATGYGVTMSNTYLEQGRYAEAVASTGAEPELVDPATPPNRFVPESIAPASTRPGGGCLALIDIDGDRNLDLFVAGGGGQRLYRNSGKGQYVDVTGTSRLGNAAEATPAAGCMAGDLDNDGAPDLFVLRRGPSRVYRNAGNGRFTDVSDRANFPVLASTLATAALVDVDHDGDLDVAIGGPQVLRLLRNNGNGTFTDTTAAAKLEASGDVVAIVPTDFDNRRDVDLLIVNRDAPPRLFKNLRDGTFADVAADVALGRVGTGGGITGVATGDVNKDEYPDFFFTTGSGAAVWAVSDGRGRFAVSNADGIADAVAAQLLDYDNDGLVDALAWRAKGPALLRNLGSRWSDVTASAFPDAAAAAAVPSASGIAVADIDGDGDRDVVVQQADGAITLWRNSGNPRNRSIGVQLRGRASNRSGVGAKVQIRAGSLSQRAETSAATPPVAPADVVFGLGGRTAADVVRVLWPSGILQAETAPAAARVDVQELDRKPSSCPFLYTWNGTRFEFITDFMGGGEMGYWERPGVRNTPDPIEYVRIARDRLRPKDGRYEIRVTNELEETLYIDRVQLWRVDHPADVEVYPNEGMTEPPKPFRLFGVRDARAPRSVVDEHGHDVADRVAHVDRRYADDFELNPIRGYAGQHQLTIDIGERSQPLLLLTGWTDYAFSSDNVAAHQAGLSLSPPALYIKDAAGRWRLGLADVGIPVGRPQTIAVDLAAVLRPAEHEIRLVTNMRIYWDQIRIGTAVGVEPRVTRLDPRTATLRQRGFSAELHPDGRDPIVYDYDRVTQTSTWKTMIGRFTREGDVSPLLVSADDQFVVAKPGDEVALDFDASAAKPPSGWTHTFLLLADGFSKEMDINSASPDRVEPLPFHGMTQYPYALPERYPQTPAHDRYRAAYNTRLVAKD